MRVLIVGAGIAGLSLAAFLDKKGIDCELVEKTDKWERKGFTFGIWYNGRIILEKLGVAEDFDNKGSAVSDYCVSKGNGEVIRLCHFDDFVKKYPPLKTQIHRADLHEILRNVSKKVPIKMGLSVSSIEENKDNVEVVFSNKPKKSYDLVVGADGINSKVRDLVFGKGFLKYLGWRGWFFWSDKDSGFPKGVFEMWEPGQFFGRFPHRGKKVCTYLAMPFDRFKKDDPNTRIKRFKKHFVDLTWQVPKIINNIKNPEDMVVMDLAHVDIGKEHKGRVILIGDAAHAMEPFAGMGCSMALEDAFVLSEELSKSGNSNEEILKSFKNYQKRRSPRLSLAKKKTREIWGWTNINSGFISFFRNLFAKYMPIKHFTEGYETFFSEKP